MDMNVLFTMALGLKAPWQVTSLDFDAARSRLDVRVDFPRGSLFPCPDCGRESKVHDAPEHSWRHLNFFQHEAHLTARHPRVRCDQHGVKQVAVPWARPGSGFTLLFEAFLMVLARTMPMAAVARLVGEHDTRLWRVVEHYVREALGRLQLEGVKRIGIDETSRARGHNYLTLVVDLDERRVCFLELGRDSAVLASFRKWLEEHGGAADQVTDVSLDMSPAYIKGVQEQFPQAQLTFDKFHVIALMNEAVEEVRREEQRGLKAPELKNMRFVFLRNSADLTDPQRARLAAARTVAKKTSRAWAYRETLQELYRQPDAESAGSFLDHWIRGASRCRLPAVRRVAASLRVHRQGVLQWFTSRITNGLLEGFSSLVQSAKRAARGYRNPAYMALSIWLRLGKLDLRLPRLA